MLFFLNIKKSGFADDVCFLSLLFQCLDKVTFWPYHYPEWSQRSWLESRTDLAYLIVWFYERFSTHTLSFLLPWKPIFNCVEEMANFLFSYFAECPSHSCSAACAQAPQRTPQVFSGDMTSHNKVIFSEICNVMEI